VPLTDDANDVSHTGLYFSHNLRAFLVSKTLSRDVLQCIDSQYACSVLVTFKTGMLLPSLNEIIVLAISLDNLRNFQVYLFRPLSTHLEKHNIVLLFSTLKTPFNYGTYERHFAFKSGPCDVPLSSTTDRVYQIQNHRKFHRWRFHQAHIWV
jgi:hypothetical protein